MEFLLLISDKQFGFIFLATIGAAVYFLPTFIAAFRNHRNAVAIMLLNLFAGWTFIGWIGALVWSAMNDKKP